MSILAVIPARYGSKGIPKKNLEVIGDKNLVEHAIAAASMVTENIVVTTDIPHLLDKNYHSIADIYKRPEHLCGDLSLAWDVWRDCALHYPDYDYYLYLEPTSPGRTKKDLEECIEKLEDGAGSTVTLSPIRDLKLHADKQIKIVYGMLKTNTYNNEPMQVLPQSFIRNGICYGATKKHMEKSYRILSESTAPVIIERDVVNIDTIDDLEKAREKIYPSSFIDIA